MQRSNDLYQNPKQTGSTSTTWIIAVILAMSHQSMTTTPFPSKYRYQTTTKINETTNNPLMTFTDPEKVNTITNKTRHSNVHTYKCRRYHLSRRQNAVVTYPRKTDDRRLVFLYHKPRLCRHIRKQRNYNGVSTNTTSRPRCHQSIHPTRQS